MAACLEDLEVALATVNLNTNVILHGPWLASRLRISCQPRRSSETIAPTPSATSSVEEASWS
jgi:hypothetical protein